MQSGLSLVQLMGLVTLLGLAAFLYRFIDHGPAALPTAPIPSPDPCATDFEVSIERTMCYGSCPAYLASADTTGTVHFEGRRFVKQVGTATWTVDRASLARLCRDLRSAGMFEMDSDFAGGNQKNCPQNWTDNPSAQTTLRMGSKTKQIRHYHGCKGSTTAEALSALEDRIDVGLETASRIR